MMLDDDEQGHRALHGNVDVRFGSRDQEPCKDGKAAGSENGSQRNESAEKQHDDEYGNRGQCGPRCCYQEDAETGGYSFAPTEFEPDGEHVSDDGAEGRKGLNGAMVCVRKQGRADQPAYPDGCAAFEHVKQERGSSEALTAGSEHVCGTDISAAHGADVLMAEDAHQKISRRNGTQQVGNRCNQQGCTEHDD